MISRDIQDPFSGEASGNNNQICLQDIDFTIKLEESLAKAGYSFKACCIHEIEIRNLLDIYEERIASYFYKKKSILFYYWCSYLLKIYNIEIMIHDLSKMLKHVDYY